MTFLGSVPENEKRERTFIVTSQAQENHAKVDAMFVICSSEMMDPRPKHVGLLRRVSDPRETHDTDSMHTVHYELHH
jgi:hypothetical protein